MKSRLFRAVFFVGFMFLTLACNSDNQEVWTPKKGELTVWDDAHGIFYSDVNTRNSEPGLSNIVLLHNYIHEAPGYTPERMSAWVQKNEDLIDKMEQQWRESPYYTPNEPLAFEFSCLEDLSIISYYNLWGRESGEELVDMFLLKPCGPFFSFPEGDILPDEEYDKWMTLEEWKSKACVCCWFHFKAKEPIDSENLILMLTTTVRDSWNTTSNTRKVEVLVGKRDGLYGGSAILSDEELERVLEWERANRQPDTLKFCGRLARSFFPCTEPLATSGNKREEATPKGSLLVFYTNGRITPV